MFALKKTHSAGFPLANPPPLVATLTPWTFSQHLGYQDQCIRVWHVNTWLLEQHVHELCMTQLWNENWEPSFSNLELLLSIFHVFFESRWVIFFKLLYTIFRLLKWHKIGLTDQEFIETNGFWSQAADCNFTRVFGYESFNTIQSQDLGINFQLMVFRCAPENSKALWSQWLALLRLLGLGELVSWLRTVGGIGVALLEKCVFIFGWLEDIGEFVAKITERPVMSFCISAQSPYCFAHSQGLHTSYGRLIHLNIIDTKPFVP